MMDRDVLNAVLSMTNRMGGSIIVTETIEMLQVMAEVWCTPETARRLQEPLADGVQLKNLNDRWDAMAVSVAALQTVKLAVRFQQSVSKLRLPTSQGLPMSCQRKRHLQRQPIEQTVRIA